MPSCGTVTASILVLPASPLPGAAAAAIEGAGGARKKRHDLGRSALSHPGLAKNLAFDVLLKVNVLIDRGEA